MHKSKLRSYLRWEWLFASRRAHAKSCQEALDHHQNLLKHRLLMQVWRPATTHRLYTKLRGVQGKMAALAKWQALCQVVRKTRGMRVIKRYVVMWRQEARLSALQSRDQAYQRIKLRRLLKKILSMDGGKKELARAIQADETRVAKHAFLIWKNRTLHIKMSHLTISDVPSKEISISSRKTKTTPISSNSGAASAPPYSAIYALLNDLRQVQELSRDGTKTRWRPLQRRRQ